jgi:histidyl-tRNA synthetase
MSAQKPSVPSGFRDFGPEVMMKRKFIMRTIEDCFIQFGFQPIETPAIENLKTLTGKYGDEGDQLLYKILNNGDFLDKVPSDVYDKKDSKTLLPQIVDKGLRYDLTVPMARYVSMNRSHITFPFKRYQMQTVWRADRPQKGRYREFWQCDADIVGSTSTFSDIELLDLYNQAFYKLGLPVIIRFNNRQVFDAILTPLAPNEAMRFMQLIDKYDKIGDKVNELLSLEVNAQAVQIWENLLAANKESGNEAKLAKLQSLFPSISLELAAEIEQNFKLSQASKGNTIDLDFTLARGLSYYTGIIYEVLPQPSALPTGFGIGSIGGGGRYDKLTEMFGFDGGQGVGISFGLDRIYDVMEAADLLNLKAQSSQNILICIMDEVNMPKGYALCQSLINQGVSAQLYPQAAKLRKQLDYANAQNIKYAAIIGQTEMENGTATVKNLITGDQQEMAVSLIAKHINPA